VKTVKFKRTSSRLNREKVEHISDVLSDWFEGGPSAGSPVIVVTIKGNYLSSKDNDGTVVVEFLTNNEYEGNDFLEKKLKGLF